MVKSIDQVIRENNEKAFASMDENIEQAERKKLWERINNEPPVKRFFIIILRPFIIALDALFTFIECIFMPLLFIGLFLLSGSFLYLIFKALLKYTGGF